VSRPWFDFSTRLNLHSLMEDFVIPAPRPTAARPGRCAAKKAYIEMSDNDDDDE